MMHLYPWVGCHGLPIEHNVEKKIGKAGVKVDYSVFRQKCRDYAMKQVAGQSKDFIRLGVFGDWDNPYLTMNFAVEADIIRALGKIVANGHPQGYKPVLGVVGAQHWQKPKLNIKIKPHFLSMSPICCTAVTVETAFPSLPGEGDISILIWTTTPWTIPSSQAISVG